MSMKRLGIVAIAAILSALVGCRKEESDKRLIDIAVKVEKQKAKIDRIARTLEAIERKLDTSPVSGKKSAPTSGMAEPAKAPQQVVEFRDTREYDKMLAALSAIQQRLNLTQSYLDEVKKDETFPEPCAKSMEDWTEGLDALVRAFGENIADPARRREFESAVEQLKGMQTHANLTLTTEDVYQAIVSDLTERIDKAQLEYREPLQAELRNLERVSTENLAKMLRFSPLIDSFARSRFAKLRELAEKYHIRGHVLHDAGLREATMHFRVSDEGEVHIFLVGLGQPQPEVVPSETEN